ncbi:MAG: fasciclin domain-containing protein, partial [Dehalococcoidia bacterium]
LQGEEVTIKVIDPNRPPLTIGNVMIDGATVLITDIIGSNGVIHVIDSVILPTEIAASLSSPEATKTIVDIAVEDGRFETLVAALQAADLVSTLSGEGPFTVFAPTDDAFAALPDGVVAGLLEDIPSLTEVLTYHVVSGTVLAETVVGLTSAATLQGEEVTIEVIDPNRPPLTIGNVMIDGATVLITDIIGSNGVIHVIDAVILPSAIAASLATPEDAMDSMVVSKTIVDIAVEDGRFGTLVTALQAAGLVETLSGDGPFTVFAPTDDAFAALPDGVVAGLLEDIPALTDVLTYHVISGSVLAEQVVGLTSATTLQGEDVTIAVNDGSVMIDGAKVIITDIIGSNGVIHVIDAVILP